VERTITGGCHCGAVRYAIGAVHASMVCHCRTCQRVTGAPVVAWLSVRADDYHVTRGEPASYASSPGIARTFCAACGSQLTYASATEEIDVTVATLDDPGAFPPTHHSWLSHNIPWIKFGDGLPHFSKSRSDG
jgi:hypothetical protein